MSSPVPAPVNPTPPIAGASKYVMSIRPGPKHHVPDGFADAIKNLETVMQMPVWTLIHDGNERVPMGEVDVALKDGFFNSREAIADKVALLIDSPGGDAKSAYQIASIFRAQSTEFTVLIPRMAKSAGTLMALGANKIILNKFAEVGPLDAQILDYEREQWASALNEVQSLDRLHAFGLEALDQTMFLLLARTKKSIAFVMPHALKFITEMMRPMLEKIDVVHYTQRARVLKVAEEYAIRLLKPKYEQEQAKQMARWLVEKYPEHDFTIDSEELTQIGIQNQIPTAEQVKAMNAVLPFLGGQNHFIGRLQEANNAGS